MLQHGPGEVTGNTMEKCKTDYEGLIKQAKTRLRLNLNLQSAIYAYTGFITLRGQMAELMGELSSESVSLKKRIEEYIADQEAESKTPT